MRLLICYSSYRGRAHGVHLHDVGERNGPHANVSDNNAKCAGAQYLDGHGKAAGMVQQTDHFYIHCAAFSCSYNHTGYNRVSCSTVDSLHGCYDHDHSIRRGHVHVHGRDGVMVVSNRNGYSSQPSLH